MFNKLYKDLLKKVEEGNQCVMLTFLKAQNDTSGEIKEKIILTRDDVNNKTLSLDEKIYQGIYKSFVGEEIITVYLDNNEIVLIEPYFPKPRLLIFGGGHIAKPLSEFAHRVGFSVTVVDDRPYFANTQRFPHADKVICEDFSKSFDSITFKDTDFVVIVTRGHRHDKLVLKNVINYDLKYIGMIGSKRRVKGLKEELIEEGFSEDALNSVNTPIGMDIMAITPDEIAISIVGELISYKNRRIVNNKIIKHTYPEFDTQLISSINNDDNTPKAILTILSSKGSVPRRAGAKMITYLDGRTVGSIGGGCSEAEVLTKAKEMMLDGGEYAIKHVDMTGEVAESLGMVCGGTMEVLIEICKNQ